VGVSIIISSLNETKLDTVEWCTTTGVQLKNKWMKLTSEGFKGLLFEIDHFFVC